MSEEEITLESIVQRVKDLENIGYDICCSEGSWEDIENYIDDIAIDLKYLSKNNLMEACEIEDVNHNPLHINDKVHYAGNENEGDYNIEEFEYQSWDRDESEIILENSNTSITLNKEECAKYCTKIEE